jgi:uncharacterized SAM-binding protein YcdF (DUF218 family)
VKRRLLLGVAAALIVGLLAAHWAALPVLRRMGHFLALSEPLEHADAIVVLAGGYPDRILEAAALYREGWAPRIVLGREPDNAGYRKLTALGVSMPRLFEVNRSIAEQLGVPPDAIAVVEHPAGSTYDEAQEVIDTVLRQGYHTILLVTSKYHSQRAAQIYRALAADRVRIVVRAARDDDFDPDAWWHDRVSTRRAIFEYQKLLAFLVIDRWRLPGVTTPTLAPATTPRT